MANITEIQTLRDTTQQTVIKLTGMFDGSGQESNTGRIVAGSLAGALDNIGVPMRALTSTNVALSFYGLSVTRIEYNINMPSTATPGYLRLNWGGAAGSNGTIVVLGNGSGSIGNEHAESIVNPLAPLGGGGIGITSVGATIGSSYTIILELRKDNAHFSRGQHADPAAFNYSPYNLTP